MKNLALHYSLLIALGLLLTQSSFNCVQAQDNSKWVAMHLLNYNSDEGLKSLGAEIPNYAAKGINTLFVEVDYHFKFTSHPELISEPYITPEGAKKFTAICKAHNIRVIPQFQSLGHQSWDKWTWSLLTKYPELDLTPGAFPENKGIYCREWDPTNPKVNQIVFPMIEEIITAFDAEGVHLGMDEIFLLGSKESPTTFGQDPGVLFAKTVNDFHDHFTKKKKLKLFIWGDRLIDSKKYPYGDWESSSNGTHTAIDKIPTDVVICDWHYELRDSYPSIPMFLEKGFKVLPCSFKNPESAKALMKYSLRQEHPNMLGHMFTSWSAVPNDSLLLYPAFTEGMRMYKQKLIWDVNILPGKASNGTLEINLSVAKADLQIYYTTNGKDPDQNSTLFSKPIQLTKSSEIKAIAYSGKEKRGEINSRSFVVNRATGQKISVTPDGSAKYPAEGGSAVLVNGVRGTAAFSDGQWLGIDGSAIEIAIELGEKQLISSVEFNAYTAPDSWIYPPSEVELFISEDGKTFQSVKAKVDSKKEGSLTTFKVTIAKSNASVVKLHLPKRIIPVGAPAGAGLPAWMFLDEIIVE